MKKTLLFSAIICLLLASCTHKEKPVRPTLTLFQLMFMPHAGIITKIDVMVVKILPNGETETLCTFVPRTDGIMSPLPKNAILVSGNVATAAEMTKRSLTDCSVGEKPNLEIQAEVVIGHSKTMRVPYVGQKVGDLIDAKSGNPICSNDTTSYSNEFKEGKSPWPAGGGTGGTFYGK